MVARDPQWTGSSRGKCEPFGGVRGVMASSSAYCAAESPLRAAKTP